MRKHEFNAKQRLLKQGQTPCASTNSTQNNAKRQLISPCTGGLSPFQSLAMTALTRVSMDPFICREFYHAHVKGMSTTSKPSPPFSISPTNRGKHINSYLGNRQGAFEVSPEAVWPKASRAGMSTHQSDAANQTAHKRRDHRATSDIPKARYDGTTAIVQAALGRFPFSTRHPQIDACT